MFTDSSCTFAPQIKHSSFCQALCIEAVPVSLDELLDTLTAVKVWMWKKGVCIFVIQLEKFAFLRKCCVDADTEAVC